MMALAGLAVAELAQALAPHTRCIWLARGHGSNGGDGLVAAKHLHQWAQAAGGHCNVVVTLSTGATIPPDAVQALNDTRSADVRFAEEPPQTRDFGIGVTRAPEGQLASWPDGPMARPAPMVAIPMSVHCCASGLDADTSCWLAPHRAVPYPVPAYPETRFVHHPKP
jgi:NAD(P)H-hydrate repair Nnr-like enzyme with NAD(P)H-hydrate epimerase domain